MISLCINSITKITVCFYPCFFIMKNAWHLPYTPIAMAKGVHAHPTPVNPSLNF